MRLLADDRHETEQQGRHRILNTHTDLHTALHAEAKALMQSHVKVCLAAVPGKSSLCSA